MRVLKDVVVHRTDTEELLAVSRAAGITGEEMTLDVMGAGASLGLRVRVLESRPVIVDGTVCHRMRLALLHDEAANADDTESPVAREIASEERSSSLSLSGPLAEAI
jgi:hypothetical protein